MLYVMPITNMKIRSRNKAPARGPGLSPFDPSGFRL
jgi:hypothetical protein